ncbi:hypothetical protein U2063_15425, partial [Listeria monocytogenes]|uniref:hypothetical protein n=1 Tax=Listeria monocytogenes TaxID=1639 RepID=UPI002FDC5BB7
MSANIIPMFLRSVPPLGPDDPWLTSERMTAYYVAISVDPEIVHAPPLVRQMAVDKVIAGLRAARDLNDAIDAKGREQ